MAQPVASTWPTEPRWAPPTEPQPRTSTEPDNSRLPSGTGGSPAPNGRPDRSRRSVLVAATIVVAALAGGGAGYAGATLAGDRAETKTVTVTAAPLSYQPGQVLDVTALVTAMTPSVVTIQTETEVRVRGPF
ncbi:MAG TPA: hypothetical protein PLV68_14340, partial [Ilumatobacteraceae bacterium]|nr:hypothetical protein [Ilumatobacteraceae bacterium]